VSVLFPDIVSFLLQRQGAISPEILVPCHGGRASAAEALLRMPP
jgi:hypothetical protein